MERKFFELKQIKIKITNPETDETRIVETTVSDYAVAKAKDLREFGYADLTEKSVVDAVFAIVSGEKTTDIIAAFIEEDLILD